MAKSAFVPMEQTLLNKEITSIAKTGNKLNIRIQIAAVNACFYSIAHGDIGFGQRLVMALNNGQRKNSLVAFLEKFGKFQWSKEQKQLIFRKRDELSLESLDEIKEHWYETIKAPEPVSMVDCEQGFERWLKNITKQAEAAATVKHKEFLDALGEFHAAWMAAQVEAEGGDGEAEDEVLSVDEQIAALMPLAVEADRQELKAA